jgi:integrin beta 8
VTVVRVPVTETVVVRVATGQPGTPGASAYDVAVANGFVGTVEEWLEDLQGADGADGAPGAPGANGTNGTNGTNGADGTNGTDGADGDSAYQVAVNNGFVGTEAAWLASLQGSDGADGTNGTNGTNGTDGADGVGVPVGGTTGQVLAKNSGTDYDTEWVDAAGSDLAVADGSAMNPHTTQGATRNSALPKNFWQYTGTEGVDDPTNAILGDEWISA